MTGPDDRSVRRCRLFGIDWRDEPPSPSRPPPARRVVLWSDGLGPGPQAAIPLARGGADAALRTLDAVRGLLRQDGERFVQVVLGEDDLDLALAAAALLRTVAAESPRLSGQVLVTARQSIAGLIADLPEEARCADSPLVRRRDGRRQARRVVALDASDPPTPRPWRDGGVYLISGGLGGLGLAFARDIAAHAAAPTLILAGRSAPGEAARAALAELQAGGARVACRAVDVADVDAVAGLVAWCGERFGPPTGVLHAAGVLRDGFLAAKTDADVAAVLAPKVAGALALDAATRDCPLDLFACFSSLAGITGNPGQADYAVANALLDGFAARRAASVAAGDRRGRSLSVNWPLWAEGGMRVDAATAAMLRREHGLEPLSTAEGMRAFAEAVASGRSQVAVACGDADRLTRHLDGRAAAASPPIVAVGASRRAVVDRLREIVAAVTKSPVAAIDALERFEAYGIDSIMVTALNQRLAEAFGPLPKSLPFEYRSIDALAGYLTEHRAAAIPAAPPVASPSTAADDPIVIVGMSGRFPEAPDLETFWSNLRRGRDCIGEIPADRWPLDGFFEPDRRRAVAQGKSYSKWGGFLPDFADFDPLFFGISPREALAMDPHERLFLEVAWETMEDAALSPETLRQRHGGRVGVFAGVTKTGFELFRDRMPPGPPGPAPRTSLASVANRVSYALDLNGPSLPIDTMCSSSLVAVHQACQSLRLGECELAFAGGVNLYLHPSSYVDLCAAGMLSGDGRCRSFGRGGDGFVPGEGVGCVLLAPRSLARRHGLRILATLRGGAVNHGGHTHGYTVPDPARQRDVVRAALDAAGVAADTISYVEAHGTGTELGDPIEIQGLCGAFAADAAGRGVCALGSVKSSIGHLEAAAGIAGLIKTVLQLRHRRLVPSLHAEEVNPLLNLDRTPFVLQRAEAAWTAEGQPRRALVSSFGAGGANACVVVEEAAEQLPARRDGTPGHPQAVLLSARGPAELAAAAARLRRWLAEPRGGDVRAGEAEVLDALRRMANLPAGEVDAATPFAECGLDATDRLRLAADLAVRHAPDADVRVLAGAACAADLAASLAAAGTVGDDDRGTDLAALAWTLQSGRRALEHRLGVKAASAAELTAALDDFLAGRPAEGRWWSGRVEGAKESRAALAADPGVAAALAALTAGRDLDRLLPLWTRGLAIDWRALHGAVPPPLLGLPATPFARRRLWFDPPVAPPQASPPPPVPEIAPAAPKAPPATGDAVRAAVRVALAASLNLDPGEIAAEVSFADYGLDSILCVGLVDALNAALGIGLETADIFDHATVERLVRHIVAVHAPRAAAPVAAAPAVVAGPAVSVAPGVREAEPIAVIGLSGRFPGAPDPDSLWRALDEGRDLLGPVDRWPLPPEVACRRGGFLSDIDRFDALFFNISGAEAAYIDPQQRLFLEACWTALEDAGHAGGSLAGSRCGVYVGCCGGDYQDLIGDRPSPQSLWGNMASVIPGRVAYCLDLKGPVMAFETACSSSLVAIHAACRDLRDGEATAALVGGVFVQATSKLYVSASRAGMLSPSGCCHPFDARADGFVPGEGVGALLLKPLSAALADGDHVHGLILGSGVNHDGATNGITAPSAESQAALLRRVYESCGVDPAAVTLVEAHGTGTALGDPIEYRALCRVFGAPRADAPPVALGSIKGNIGHGQYAAGVSGVIKVLLALRHRTIPASLHYVAPNPRIDWAAGRFRVPTASMPWGAPAGGRRIGAVSSFGASGTNAHVVIAEAPAPSPSAPGRPPFLVVLSARGEDALRELARRVADRCAADPGLSCADLSYSLAAGRKVFEWRLVAVADDVPAVAAALRGWLAGKADGDVFCGRVGAAHVGAEAPFDPGCAGAERRAALRGLAERFVGGDRLPLRSLFQGEIRRRLPLPTTVFADARHWLPSGPPLAAAAPALGLPGARLRPLPDEGGRRVFALDLRADAYPLADHHVAGAPVLPGVAFLALLRDAAGVGRRWRVGDVAWARPVAPRDNAAPCRLTLAAAPDGGSVCEIVQGGETAATARLHPSGEAAPPPLDLAEIAAGCGEEVSAARCYAALVARGIMHGPALRALAGVRRAPGLAVAELILPEGAEPFTAILDAAIQASAALMPDDAAGTAIPFAADSVEVFAPCAARMTAVLRGAPERLDVDVCDPSGAVCVRLRGLTSRLLRRSSDAAPLGETLLLKPVWEAFDLPAAPRRARGPALAVGLDAAARDALAPVWPDLRPLDLDAADLADRLAAAGDVAEIVWVAPRLDAAPGDEALIAVQETQALALLRLVRALAAAGADARPLTWTLITEQARAADDDDPVRPAAAGLHGMFGSLAREYPDWRARVCDLEAGPPWPAAEIAELPADGEGTVYLHRRGGWRRLALLPLADDGAAASPYRDGGVYVVIGGGGGVGGVWTEGLLRRCRAQAVWVGRGDPGPEMEARLDVLAALGPRPVYLRADAADAAALAGVRDRVMRDFGRIDGVVLSALTLSDRTLARMDDETLRRALRSKADVAVRLAQVFDVARLDFVLAFSSIQSFARMPGQGNYAAGCLFGDSHARLLERVCGGKARVINWGWWADVGAVRSDEHRARMNRAGLAGLTAPRAMAALDTLLGGPHRQLALVSLLPGGSIAGLHRGETLRRVGESCPPPSAAVLAPPPRQADVPRLIARVGGQMDDMDAEMARLLWAQMASAGLFPGATYAVADLASRLPPLYRGGWLAETLRVLVRHGFLEAADERGGRIVAPPGAADAAEAWRAFHARAERIAGASDLRAHLRLVETMLKALPEILSGRRAATAAMFPKSSLDLVEGVYRDNPVADHFNAVLCDVLEAAVAERLAAEPKARLRILEVGAGTGGTAIRAFERLRRFGGAIAEYCYTDLSKAFLIHAEKSFRGEAPFLSTRLFDLDRPVAVQGVPEGAFDVAIATNVLHATRSVRAALRNLKAAMKRGGLLLLNELSANALFSHLTFGLLDGWWAYDDAALRLTGTPALTPDTWRRVLESEGFGGVVFPAAAAHRLGQQVVACVGDGLVRQRVGDGAAVAPSSPPPDLPPDLPPPVAVADGLRDRLRHLIRQLLSETLAVAASDIRFDEPLERYGVDSILVLQVVARLRAAFGEASSTLLFEANTVDALADHFLSARPDAVRDAVGAPSSPPSPSLPPSRPVAARAEAAPRSAAIAVEAGPVGRRPEALDRDIAIVGMAGRYAGADDLAAFWENLIQGRDCIREIPAERFDWRPHFDERRGQTGRFRTRFGGFIEGVDRFDPLFFQLSPAEAERMDPQERLFLQETWHAAEDAGYDPRRLGRIGRVGVFAGVSAADYVTGAAFWSVANRVSFLLDLKGPSMAVDTACSSSLTALHLAVESLRAGGCDVALAGGVNLILTPRHLAALSELAMLSPSGRCRAFGAEADGFADGEGVGVVVLRRLRDAVAAGDDIRAVIVGASVNSGGRASSYTAPSPAAQAEVITAAWRDAGIDPRAIGVVEAHGTGTALGDPIEVDGLARAFRGFTPETGFCALGSVKSNIGHCEGAAGVAGLTKAVLQLQNAAIVPTLHAEEENPHLDLAATPLFLPRRPMPWERWNRQPRLAAVSSFGAGGANAHVVLREAPEIDDAARGTPPDRVLLTLSARTGEQLAAAAAALARHLKARADTADAAFLADAAFTLQTGRCPQPERLAVVAADVGEAVARLEEAARGAADGPGLARGTAAPRDDDGLAADEEFRALLAAWVAKGRLHRIGEMWASGAAVDWAALYPGWTPRRRSLPGTVFAGRRYWLERDDAAAASSVAPSPPVAPISGGATIDRLRALVGEELRLPPGEIDDRTPLEDYGLDSVAVIRLIDRLETLFGDIPSTLFYEHHTLAALADWLAENRSGAVASLEGASSSDGAVPCAAAREDAVRPVVADGDGIAIIGLAGRYPMADDLDAFWSNLRDGRDCIVEIPPERWNHAPLYDPNRAEGLARGKWGGFLSGIDRFDARFFGMLPDDAALADPQERLFVECVFRAIESAGHSPRSLAAARPGLAGGDVGVYVGATNGEYPYYGVSETARGRPTAIFCALASIANRVSYGFGFHGPSLAVDTMCSSSLTALHLACQALRAGDCRVAVAGGVNLSLHPNKYLAMARGGFDSALGRCAAFGAGGDGYVPAEGVGAVILKPLAQAIADGDRVLGVVKATGVNHGGKANGYTVPDPAAQAALIGETLARSGVPPRGIGYVEAHGTGTLLGDPVEIAGLSRAFARFTPDTGFCAIGSVKSVIGHAESAAGIAGLTKVLLQMRHRELAPTLHAETLNPRIDFAATPFVVQRRRAPWRAVDGQPLRACVSSFGAGGSNAHAVIEEAPPLPSGGADESPQVVTLSARTPQALSRMVADLATRLAAGGDDFADLAFTLQTGREGYEERLAFVAASADEAAAALSAIADGRPAGVAVHRGRTRRGAGDEGTGGVFASPDAAARAWVEGQPVDWRGRHRGGRRRVALPPYPLDPVSHWHPAGRVPLIPVAAKTEEVAVTKPGPEIDDEGETLLLRAIWRDEPAHADGVAPSSRLVLLCGFPAALAESFRRTLGEVPCRVVGAASAESGSDLVDLAQAVLTLARELLLGEVRRRPALVQLVAPVAPSEALSVALSGLAGTLAQETSSPVFQSIAVDPADDPAVLARLLEADSRRAADRMIRHGGGRRRVRRLAELPPAPPPSRPWRDGGCYVITGGLGGLARRFAHDIVAHARHPVLALIGRSPTDDSARSVLEELEAAGARASYHAVDVADAPALAALIGELRAEHGAIDGVLHAAGIHRDALLIRKDIAASADILSPKIAGTLALDAATATDALDFFVCFASLAGLTGNLGQADYAMGNGFLDGFAAWRNRRVARGERAGRTVSIDWPLWAEGGMTMPTDMIALVRDRFGLTALPTQDGFDALARALASGEDQVAVVHGLRDRILERMDGGILAASAPASGVAEESVEEVLLKLVARELHLDEAEVDRDQPLGEFGFDSISLTALAANLGKALGREVSPAVLFAQPTLAALARHLAAEGGASSAPPSPTARAVAPVAPAVSVAAPRRPKSEDAGDDAVAIVGVSAAFPGARDIDAFWSNLLAGRDAISEIPPDRWDWREIWGDPVDHPGCTDVKWGGFLDGVAEFDPRFFGLSSRDAELIDPQQRLLLMHVWHAIEDSGHAPSSLAGSRTAVFLATASGGYVDLAIARGLDIATRNPAAMTPSVAPNRVSYFLDLHGPSEMIDTACSSGLVAVHRGVEAIRRGEATQAIVGAASLILTPMGHVGLSRAGMLSRRGRCRTFMSDADGYVRGEGVGALVLKPLSAALADGDPIHAVIRGSGVNHGGRAHSLTAPNSAAQADLLIDVYRRAGIDPRSVTFLEAHGTGTVLGDPVEIDGLTGAFRQLYQDWGVPPPSVPSCGLGSVKTHVGHLEVAAGISALVKVLLQMRHRTQIANLHVGEINPHIDLTGTPFEVVRANRPWTAGRDEAGREAPRRAGISSFGYGGVNAHVVVEEYPMPPSDAADDGCPVALLLSARDGARLAEACRDLRDWISRHRDGGRALLADVAYTLQIGRDAMAARLGLVASSLAEAEDKLFRHIAGETGIPGLFTGLVKRSGGAARAFDGAAEAEPMAAAWVGGAAVDWRVLHGPGRRRVRLPGYPFARGRYWLPDAAAAASPAAAAPPSPPPHPLIHAATGSEDAPVYVARLSGAEPFLRDHRVGGRLVFPGAGFLEMALAAAGRATRGWHGRCLRDVRFERFAAPDADGLTLEVALENRPDGGMAFAIGSGGAAQRVRHCRGVSYPDGGAPGERLDLAAIRARMRRAVVSGVDCRKVAAAMDLAYGPSYQGLLSVAVGEGELLADIALPKDSADLSPAWVMNPALLDAALQSAIGFSVGADGGFGTVRGEVPIAVRELTVTKPLPPRLFVWLSAKGGNGVDMTLCGKDGEVCVRLLGFRTFPLAASVAAPSPVPVTPPPGADAHWDAMAAWVDAG
jgi:acyl transferase domain-containing protein/aryl carrier-like protein/short-subunit dehydrogenase involved in D-alanine esterification of teichoic acids